MKTIRLKNNPPCAERRSVHVETYRIMRVDAAPNWSRIPALQVENYQWQPPLPISMQARICHDGQNLHLHLQAQEQNIRAEHHDALAMVCEDSCMEFFFCPAENDLRYFNFEINPNAAMFIGFGHGKADLVRLLPPAEQFLAQAQFVSGGWQAQYRIPAQFIRLFFPDFALETGRVIRANFYKCGHKTLHPHYITWNPVQSDVPSFHRPQDFASLILE